jgi:glutamyl-tRNA reductase
MLVVVGLSHRTADIGVRETLAIAGDQVPEMLRAAVANETVAEALLVSTCNRVELVIVTRDAPGRGAAWHGNTGMQLLSERSPAAAPHLYCHVGSEAVRHVLRVAASLDSLVVGEPQILGQLKQAFELACRSGTVGSTLHRLVSRAIHAAKRVRSETTIGSGQVSVPTVAVDLARQIFGDLKGHGALLIGSGEMAETSARLFCQASAAVRVIGRSEERVNALAREVGAEPRCWADLAEALAEADVVITSTSAPHHVIDMGLLLRVQRARRGRSLFFIDLAVPRDVDPRANDLGEVFVYNIDDLSRIVADAFAYRRKEAELAEEIIAEELRAYDRRADSDQATPTIVALRERFGVLLRHELGRSLRGRLKHLQAREREALDRMVEAMVNRLLHAPSTNLRQAAIESAAEQGSLDLRHQVLTELFELDRAHLEPVEEEELLLASLPQRMSSGER